MYWLSKQLNISFSPYEDRLVLRAQRAEHDVVTVLLTRRMVMIVLQRLLSSLPELTGLEKMPAQYWQEVLQMAHQKAMQAKHDADNAQSKQQKAVQPAAAREGAPAASAPAAAPATETPIFLATELKTQLADKELTLAFNGLPMPRAMTTPSAHEPIFAAPLQADHVHQLIELLINKANDAQWHLPVNLPWLENPALEGTTSLGHSTVQH